jgi:hypothetical protein
MPTNVWNHTLDLSAFYHDDSLTIREKAQRVVDTIKRQAWYESEWTFEIEDVVEEFEDFARVGDSVALFDKIMDDLYDFANGERIWVKTREGM